MLRAALPLAPNQKFILKLAELLEASALFVPSQAHHLSLARLWGFAPWTAWSLTPHAEVKSPCKKENFPMKYSTTTTTKFQAQILSPMNSTKHSKKNQSQGYTNSTREKKNMETLHTSLMKPA